MATLLAHPPRDHADEPFQRLLKRRSRPSVIILNDDLNVAFSDPYATALLEARFRPYRRSPFLPVPLRDAIGELIRRWGRNAAVSGEVVGPVNGLMLRLVPLTGRVVNCYAVLLENAASREDLKEAVTRYSLTPREVEVLNLILGGMRAAEIAQTLHIAELTVFDHFKHISHKTDARNRADMLAKVFNWQPALRSNAAAPRARPSTSTPVTGARSGAATNLDVVASAAPYDSVVP